MIKSFRNDYFFLSNFSRYPVTYNGITYPTLEHAYQAQRTDDPRIQVLLAGQASPAFAKREGRYLIPRSDWESSKLKVMEDLLQIKFNTTPSLKEKLVATGLAIYGWS